jgi:hypothetical protein
VSLCLCGNFSPPPLTTIRISRKTYGKVLNKSPKSHFFTYNLLISNHFEKSETVSLFFVAHHLRNSRGRAVLPRRPISGREAPSSDSGISVPRGLSKIAQHFNAG